MRNLFLFCGLILINCATPEKYNSEILDDNFSEIDILLDLPTDTLILDVFYDIETSEDIIINQANSIIEISSEKFWVSDFLGKVVELDNTGSYRATILQTGKGPNEILKPIGMTKNLDNEVYIFDGGQLLFVKLDTSGNELRRINSKSLSSSAMIDQPIVINQNKILWKKIFHSEYALIEWDSLGNFSKGMVNSLVKPGENPAMLNNLVYDYDISTKTLTYAFKPLPSIFIKKSDKIIKQINLHEEITDYSFAQKVNDIKERKTNRVSNLIKEVFLLKEGTLVAYQNNVLFLPNDENKEMRSYQLFDKTNNKAIFHYAVKTANYLFLIDSYNKKIYRVELDKISN